MGMGKEFEKSVVKAAAIDTTTVKTDIELRGINVGDLLVSLTCEK